jgi:hypothetical protein
VKKVKTRITVFVTGLSYLANDGRDCDTSLNSIQSHVRKYHVSNALETEQNIIERIKTFLRQNNSLTSRKGKTSQRLLTVTYNKFNLIDASKCVFF